MPGHCSALGIADQQESPLPLQAQGYRFGFSRVHDAEKIRKSRIVRKRSDSQPACRDRLRNPFGSGPARFSSSFPMHGWRNETVAEQATKQLQPLDSGQGDQWAGVGDERGVLAGDGLRVIRG